VKQNQLAFDRQINNLNCTSQYATENKENGIIMSFHSQQELFGGAIGKKVGF